MEDGPSRRHFISLPAHRWRMRTHHVITFPAAVKQGARLFSIPESVGSRPEAPLSLEGASIIGGERSRVPTETIVIRGRCRGRRLEKMPQSGPDQPDVKNSEFFTISFRLGGTFYGNHLSGCGQRDDDI